MKRILAVLAVLGIWAAVAAPPEAANKLTAKDKSEGWTLLFDGKTLDGWTRTGKAVWNVKDGAIALRSDDNGNLFTNDTYDNFELKLEFRTTSDVNSGIFLRYTPAPPNSNKQGGGMPGYEVQIREDDKRTLKDSAPDFNTGSLVGVMKANKTEIRDGQWNQFDITAQGDHFVIVYNGKTILDAHDSKHASGKIALQWATHSVTGKGIEFRSIMLKRLS
ncbi:MAG: DUF1080 domain-containing protein [Acidobacteriota bacterium]